MCGMKLSDKVAWVELRDKLGPDDTVAVLLRNRLQRKGHTLWKADNEWVKRYLDFVVEGARPRDRPNRTWK